MTNVAITAEDLYKINNVTDPQLSPCGEKVVFVQTSINDKKKYESHLFVYTLADRKTCQWTYGEYRDHSPRWSPCGKNIIFVSNRSGQSQLWILPTSGGESQQLTKLKNGASNPSWSPDGNKLLFITSLAQDETVHDLEKKENEESKLEPLVVDRIKYKSDEVGFVDHKNKQLAIINLEDKTVQQLTTNPYDHSPGSWSPDGKMIAFSSNQLNDYALISDLYTLDVATGEMNVLTNGKGIFSNPTWSFDGKQVACFGHEKEFLGATQMKVWIFNIETKEKACLTEQWDVHTSDAVIGDMRSGHPNPGPIWSEEGTELTFIASQNGMAELYKVNINGTITQLTDKKGHVYGFSYLPAIDKAILAYSDPLNPGDLYEWQLSTNEEQRLTNVNEQLLNSVLLSKPEPFQATSSDGGIVPGWLMKPINVEKGKKYPLILEIHGGPHAMYGLTFFHELQLLAANGYAVLFTNPRGSHGYGQTFVDACRGDYGGMDYEDLMCAVDQVLDAYPFLDRERLGVTGGSYGGFMTNWIVGHTNRFKAAVTLRSISNWISFYGVSDIGYFFTEWEIGSTLLDDPDKLWKHSPLRYVNQIETPLLILHGERDYRCPIEQAEQLYVALKHRKVDTKLVRFPNSNHELSRSGEPTLRIERLNHIINWFNEKI